MKNRFLVLIIIILVILLVNYYNYIDIMYNYYDYNSICYIKDYTNNFYTLSKNVELDNGMDICVEIDCELGINGKLEIKEITSYQLPNPQIFGQFYVPVSSFANVNEQKNKKKIICEIDYSEVTGMKLFGGYLGYDDMKHAKIIFEIGDGFQG